MEWLDKEVSIPILFFVIIGIFGILGLMLMMVGTQRLSKAEAIKCDEMIRIEEGKIEVSDNPQYKPEFMSELIDFKKTNHYGWWLLFENGEKIIFRSGDFCLNEELGKIEDIRIGRRYKVVMVDNPTSWAFYSVCDVSYNLFEIVGDLKEDENKM